MDLIFGGAVFSPLLWRVRRPARIEPDDVARSFIEEAAGREEIHVIAHRPRAGEDPEEYAWKSREQREDDPVLAGEPALFLEVVNPSESAGATMVVRGAEVGGFRVLRAEGLPVPDTIAAVLLYLRDATGGRPHRYFGWKDGNPARDLLRSLLFGRETWSCSPAWP